MARHARRAHALKSAGALALVALVAGSATAVAPGASAAQSNPGTVVAGGNGRGALAEQLARPEQVAGDTVGRLYVADSFNNRAVRWDAPGGPGIAVAGGSLGGLGAYPAGIGVDAAGRVFVADTFNHRVVRWDPPPGGGTPTGVVVAGGPGVGDANAGFGPDQLNNPTQLAVTADGTLYVADTGNDRVMRWAPGATTGQVVAGGQGRGPDAGQLALPVGLAVNDAGDLWVGDTQNNRVVKFAAGGQAPVVVAGGGPAGTGPRQLSGPTGVTVDAAGTIFVADTQNHRVMRFAPGSPLGTVVAGGRGAGAGTDQLNRPVGVLLDGKGGLLVGDRENDRVIRVAASGTNAVLLDPAAVPTTAAPTPQAPVLTQAPYVPPPPPGPLVLDPAVQAAILAANGGAAQPLPPAGPTVPPQSGAAPQAGAAGAQGFPTSPTTTSIWARPVVAPASSRGPLGDAQYVQLLALAAVLAVGATVLWRRSRPAARRS